jgi:uncharacterized iron-regulated membrane protein
MPSALTLRRWHTYMGLLTAPSVLFFALTGAVQIFSLHEAHGDYHPLPIVEKLSAVHKEQVFEQPHEHGPPSGAPDAPSADASPAGASAADQPHDKPDKPDDDDDHAAPATFVLKCFFFVVSLALTISTSFGIWIGISQTRQPRLSWTLLSSGCLIPLILLFMA